MTKKEGISNTNITRYTAAVISQAANNIHWNTHMETNPRGPDSRIVIPGF